MPCQLRPLHARPILAKAVSRSSSVMFNHFHVVPLSRRHPRPAARTGRITRPVVASWSGRRPPPLYSARVNAGTRKAGNVETRRRAPALVSGRPCAGDGIGPILAPATTLRPSWRRAYDWPPPLTGPKLTLMIAPFRTKRANFGHSDKKWVSAIVFLLSTRKRGNA